MSEALEACLQSITSGDMYSSVPHIDIICKHSFIILTNAYTNDKDIHHVMAVLLQLFGQTEVNDPEVVVVLEVREHDVEGLEIKVEDPLAVYEVDTSHNLKIRPGVMSGSWL